MKIDTAFPSNTGIRTRARRRGPSLGLSGALSVMFATLLISAALQSARGQTTGDYFRIQAVALDSGTNLNISFPSDPRRYYVLCAALL
jgi:hypothetical protein